MVGAGSIGERHLRCFLATGRSEVAVVEIRPELRDQMHQRYAAIALETVEAGLAWRPTAAVIATPAPSHVELARTFLEQEAHVLIEKPLALSMQGVPELEELARATRCRCGVAYVYRSHGALAAMRDFVNSGELGNAMQVVVVAGQHFPFYRPAYRETYYANRATGGGAIQDALTHLVNAVEWLVGPTDKLVADAAHRVLEGVEVEDTVGVLARNGRTLVSYALNQHQAPNELTITVACERGTAQCDYHANRWRSLTTPGGSWTERQAEPLERDQLFIRQANQFLDAVEGRGELPCPLADGVTTLRTNLAILRSVDEGGWQSVI